MRIRELFTVPEGEKVTEKIFGRVLLSSICGILLCMTCLISTTWAWFAVSIENRGNEIQIASVSAKVDIDGVESTDGNYSLVPGTYNVCITLESDLEEPKSPVYVMMSVNHSGEQKYYCFTFENGNKEMTRVLGVVGEAATVSFSVSWVRPVSAEPVVGEALVIGDIPTESVTESKETETAAG